MCPWNPDSTEGACSRHSAVTQDSLGTLPSEWHLQISVLEIGGRKAQSVPSPPTLALLTIVLFSVLVALSFL